MSTLRDPVGPKDRKVYIRRRIFVLLGLVAVVAVVVLLFLKPGATGNPKDVQNVEVPADVTAQDAEKSAKPSDSKHPAACTEGQIVVTAVTDKTDYPAEALPKLSLKVENTGKEACSADLGTAEMEFTIASGDDQVWRSTDCQENPKHLAVVLEPGKSLTSEPIQWDRTRSSKETCDITRDPVAAGGASYHLTVNAGGVKSERSAQFLLY
ncbi:hypothetical protein JD292_11430 [Leucobacter sp. CSA2]|uniref:DUF4232 domain-containing protein n=1 Tax=Leucobacter edaphi TaxID=2796472 RepID=A0A934QE72_9MICO|nr:hypothetical protein [Leucobacter edaphi]MBK0422683.1 hypothetical protein [Leucobacter edaphi]